ncbi:hypothetical protein FQZ97_917750 [compost metagenome]
MLRLLRTLALALLWLAGPALAAELHLRGHWFQVVDGEDCLVGVLSREELGDAISAELYLRAYRDGAAIGEEVHYFTLSDTVRLFAIPLEEDVDCYQVLDLVGLDEEGEPVSSADDTPPAGNECQPPGLLPVEAVSPVQL